MPSLTNQMVRSRRFRAIRAAATGGLIRVDRLLARPGAWALAVAAVLALQGLLIATHRPWLDEIQALQLAVEAPDLPTLFAWLRYEGHPPLFYLLLRGLAHVVDPLTALPLLAAVLAAITQCCILFASPFARAERVLIALSEFVLFDFLTISRSMTLGVALLVLALALWRSRWVWAAIALLPMCDFLFGVLSGILVVLKVRERAIFWPGAAAWVAVGLAAAWSVRPAPDMVPALVPHGFFVGLLSYLSALGTLALPFQGGLLPTWNAPVFPLAGILWVPFVILCWTATRRDRLHRALMFGFIGLTLVFSLAIYPLAIRHLMLIALLLIALTWLGRKCGAAARPGFRLWLSVAALCGVATGGIALAVPFNSAPEAAAEIERLGLADSHWMAWPESPAQVIAALSGIDFERTERHCMQSGIRWNHRTALTSARRLERYLAAEVARHGRFHLLTDRAIVGFPPSLVRPLASIPAGYDGQAYYLYTVGPGAAERDVDLPPCMAGRRPFARL